MIGFDTEVVAAREATTYQLIHREQRFEGALTDFPARWYGANEGQVGGHWTDVEQVTTDTVVTAQVAIDPFGWVEVEPVLLTVQR
ncbi:hypothetical protein D3C85_1698470 [compost metagenome]